MTDNGLFRSIASLRLSVAVLACAMVLVYFGTWAQIDSDIHRVQREYFHSWYSVLKFGTVLPRAGDGELLIPGDILFPGGYTVGLLMLLNLAANWFVRYRFGWKKSGIHLIHAGLVLLLLGEAWTSISQVDSRMVLEEGETRNFTEDARAFELAIVDRSPAMNDKVYAIAGGQLYDGNEVAAGLPFAVKIEQYAANSQLFGPMQAGAPAKPRATAGAGVGITMLPVRSAGGVSGAQDTPAVYVTAIEGGVPRATYLLSLWSPVDGPQKLSLADGREFWMQLRPKRYQKPYSLTLIDFRHDRYAGTGMARNFSSRVRLVDRERGVDREELIWMNHPLRYRGEAFYQASFAGENVTVLQVVRNPAMWLPYLACAIGSLGLIIQLGVGLGGYLGSRAPSESGTEATRPGRWAVAVPAAFAVVCALVVGGRAAGSRVATDDVAQVPVYFDGRLQPLDTLARNALRAMNARAEAMTPAGERVEPMQWMLDSLARPAAAADYRSLRIDSPDVRSTLRLDQQRNRLSLSDILPRFEELRAQAQRASEVPANQRDLAQHKVLELWEKLDLLDRVSHLEELRLTPPASDGGDWSEVEEGPLAAAISASLDSYQNTGSLDARQWLSHVRSSVPRDMPRMRLEVMYNRYEPFIVAMAFYVAAFLGVCVSLLAWRVALWRSAMVLMLAGFVVQTVAMGVRMYLQGRPPVTNLYSSAIFIGWGAVLLALVLELFSKKGIVIGVASLVGTATLIIAHQLAQGGDTMGSLQAVLDSNFWLTTHVLAITYGYSAVFVAGMLGIVYLAARPFMRGFIGERSRAISRMIYGTACFALFFSFVGTVLGGIWADQSWGRFWGWDPKENGAVLIVLWLSLMLHLRHARLGDERAMAVAAVFGNTVTAWSWFGTNMLGVGLHSYGFMNSAMWWLLAFVVSQLLVMLLGLLPSATPVLAEQPEASLV